MMKNKFLSAGVMLATIAAVGTASAADLAVKAPYAAAPAYSFSWTGFYIGVEGGGGAQFDSFTGKSGVGGFAGGQIGYNYQINGFVVGIEGEGLWSDIRSRADNYTLTPGGGWFASTQTNDAFYDVAVRFGYTFFERTLIYGKLGAVWSNQKYNYNDSNSNSITASWTTPGVLLGGGFEYAITNNWITRLETDLMVFDATDATFTASGPSGGSSFASTRQTVNTVNVLTKLGISYKF